MLATGCTGRLARMNHTERPCAQEIKEAPFCNAESTRNKHGKAVMRLRFESFEALEAYFADELIGSDMMEGSASKVIGTTLLIWDRN